LYCQALLTARHEKQKIFKSLKLLVMEIKQKITTCLWYNQNAEEAVKFYTSVFKNSKIGHTSYYTEGMHLPKGEVLTIEFELMGREFVALNGGPLFKFTEALSLIVNCEDQKEVDYYWEKLVEGGGEHGPCGWLKDKYGLSWQVTPVRLIELMKDKDEKKAAAATQAMLKMSKIVIADVEKAFNNA
jgi:predicted 3-demethylubiquinone-9 3-methyltransferase (glyoxalase superfamily)